MSSGSVNLYIYIYIYRIAADPLFLPPQGAATLKKSTADILPENKFTLIFDERIDGPILNEVANKCQNVISKST